MIKLHILTGPDRARSYDLKDDPVYIGRSPEDGIQMNDSTVSRRHLKIFRRGNKTFIKDLNSQNGTFVAGREIPRGIDCEVGEGVPVVIGMSVLCLGKGCLEYVMPVLQALDLSKDIREDSGIFLQHKSMTTEKILELVYKVTELLGLKLDLDQILEKIVDYIFDFLGNIDRAVIVLMDRRTGEFPKVTSRVREPGEDTTTVYNRDVVERVIREGKGVMASQAQGEVDEDFVDTLKLSKIQSVLCVPLVNGSQIRGAIYVDSQRAPYGFRKEDLSLFADLGRRAALAIENALFYGTSGEES